VAITYRIKERLRDFYRTVDPNAEVAITYRIKERLRDFYRTVDPAEARRMLEELKTHCLKRAMPPRSESSDARSDRGSTRSATTTWPG